MGEPSSEASSSAASSCEICKGSVCCPPTWPLGVPVRFVLVRLVAPARGHGRRTSPCAPPLVVDVSPWLDHLAVLRQKLGCGGFVLDEQDRLRGLDDREKEVDDASDRGVREDDGDALDQHVQL
eukprot:CAMPEP_0181225346 /NCGR_PEP_ID=MMETSP1096-20121128/31636_1 /TAXON_ID=156174 ORGANISM="Chrysochromulina ericina, Strain CCMP281" /NCGR_SAMPLE_ID=MMETSP1096 /ASSEMBLY_ACC=CAM_ASM_000453 /LENGTH=123 /DNA_ID=CAMNT_0023318539 /DNA_START=690 /DNA_END=1057 /DNA_ORIENTATION=+